jgi:hypothetical protein
VFIFLADSLSEVKVNLKTRDLRHVVSSVLKACSLSTEAAEKITKSAPPERKKSYEDFKDYTDGFDVREEIRKEKSTYSLKYAPVNIVLYFISNL